VKTVEEWKTKRLDEIGTIVSGSTPSTSVHSFWDGDIVWVTPNDLSKLNTPYFHNSAKRITEKGLNGCSAHLLPAMSVVMSSRAPIGYVALPTVEFCTNQGCKSIVLKNKFHSEFTYYNILFHIDKIRNMGEGTTFAEISKTVLSAVELNFPASYAVQAKIAEVLSTVDRAIEQTEALIAKQQSIKTGLMQDLLTRGIDEHGNLRSEKTHKFKDSPLGRIPVEWTPTQIGSAATLQRGHDITENDLRDGPYPVISSSGVIGYHAECTSKGPNVVVGRKGTIGRVHYSEYDFWAHDTSLYVTDFWGNDERYIFYLFNHLDLARYGTKSGSPSLNRNDIHPLWIGLPSPDEQGKIATILKRYDQGLDSLGRGSGKLRALKTALMQDLLTGNRRVTVLTVDTKRERGQ
jgi:type I restriction enzyme S subunit